MDKPQEKLKVTRRNFLKGVGLATAGAATLAACSTREVPVSVATPEPTSVPIPLQYPDVPYTPMLPPTTELQVLTPHESRTVEALTARILPGTPDDPGAREAGVVYYIDNLLAYHEGFNEPTYREPPFVQVYSGDKPPKQAGATVRIQSSAHSKNTPTPTPSPIPSASPTPTPTLTPPPPDASELTSTAGITGTAELTTSDQTATMLDVESPFTIIWVPASEIARYGYQSILSPREVYRIGVAAVDRYTGSNYGSDFVDLSEDKQDEVIGAMADGKIADADFDRNLSAESFFHNLRRHTAEGMFSDPVYGGNRQLVGWSLVGYPGAQRAYEPWEFQQEGTDRQPQSIMVMNVFNAGQPANPNVILPVSGSDEDGENR